MAHGECICCEELAEVEAERERWAKWAVLAAEVAPLRARVATLEHAIRSLLDREDFWRNAGTLPGEYDNLVDVVGRKP